MPKYISLSLILIAFIIGIGAGFTLTPEYAVSMAEKENFMKELGQADRYIDKRYLEGMIAHHQAAIYMANQAKDKSHREEIRNLAKIVIKTDEASIKELYQWKLQWFKDSKSVDRYEEINLGENDGRFDLRFINALVAHHEEAISVAKEIRTKSSRTDILNLADSVIQSLSSGKDQLLQWRADWYGI